MSSNGEANFEMAAPTPASAQDISTSSNEEVAAPVAADIEASSQSTTTTPPTNENDVLDTTVESPSEAQVPESDVPQKTLSEKIAQANSAENAQDITIEHFEHLLRMSGCTEEEIKELLSSEEAAVPSMKEAAMPEDESAPEQAEGEEEENKKTFLEILRKQLKKLGTPEEIEDHLNRLGFNIGQKMGDGFAKFVEENADFGEFIRYLGTNEYYGKVAHNLGYKGEEELQKEGYTAVGAEEIEAYTGLNAHNELALMIEGLQEAQLCSAEEAQRYLKREPKEVYESIEFKLMLQRLIEGNMYHTKFSDRVAYLASHGVAKARLSDEGFTHMLMISERGKIAEKPSAVQEATPPLANENPSVTEPQPRTV